MAILMWGGAMPCRRLSAVVAFSLSLACAQAPFPDPATLLRDFDFKKFNVEAVERTGK